jgi:hypothetical protein
VVSSWGVTPYFPVDFTDFSGERTAFIFRVETNKLTARSKLQAWEHNIKVYV